MMLLGVLVALIKIAELATVIPGVALFALGALVFLLAGDPGELRSARGVGPGRVGRRADARRAAPLGSARRRRRERGRPDRDAAGAAELRGLRPAVASRARRGRRALPALRRGARLPQARQPPAHLGLPDRRRGLLHPGEPAAGADHDHGRPARDSDTILQGVVLLWSPTGWPLSLIVLVASIMIPSAKILALAYLLVTVQRGSIENNEQRIRLYRMVAVRRPLVDGRRLRRRLHGVARPAPAADVGGAGARLVFLRGGRGADDARGRVLRPAADLGSRQLERGSPCLTPTDRFPVPPQSRAVSKKRTRLSLVWVIPIVAAIAGAWVAVTRILGEGPTITIVFKSAEGLEAGKTKIQYNGVDVGTVTTVRLSEDHEHVIATAQMAPKTEGFLVEDTRFWVVRPRISGANVSRVGNPDLRRIHRHGHRRRPAKAKRDFVALEAPPIVTEGVAGRFFMLKTPDLGSLDTGTPLFFRRLQVGEVASYELDHGRSRPDRQGVRQRALRSVRHAGTRASGRRAASTCRCPPTA